MPTDDLSYRVSWNNSKEHCSVIDEFDSSIIRSMRIRSFVGSEHHRPNVVARGCRVDSVLTPACIPINFEDRPFKGFDQITDATDFGPDMPQMGDGNRFGCYAGI